MNTNRPKLRHIAALSNNGTPARKSWKATKTITTNRLMTLKELFETDGRLRKKRQNSVWINSMIRRMLRKTN